MVRPELESTETWTQLVAKDFMFMFTFTYGVICSLHRKILAAGNQNIGRARIWFMELHRFNVDGSLDPNFGAAIACPGNGTFRLAPDGKIVIVTAIPESFSDPSANPGFCISRLNADGTLDTVFGTPGKTIVKAGVNVAIGDFFIDAAGAITVVGLTTTGATFRLASNGTPDAAFGLGGIVESEAIGKVSAAIGDCSSRTIAAGPGPGSGTFSAARLLPNGAIDGSFAGTPSGFAQTKVGSTPYPLQLLVRPDGHIVVLAIDRALNVLNILQFQGDPAWGGASGGTVVEFHNTILDTYFITANSNEAAAIVNGGAGPGWSRTGYAFKSGGSKPVCRFYGSLSPGPHSHFYTLAGPECNSLMQLQASTPSTQKRWNFESLDFVSTPAGTNGTCPTGTAPVYRAYNNGFTRGTDSNHRLTTSEAIITDLVARGWSSEGVVMCAPE